MMPYLQSGRLMRMATPLGPNVVLLIGLRSREAMSELFSFQLDLLLRVTPCLNLPLG